MNKEQQDLAWRCLPKEVREDIRVQYREKSIYSWDEGFDYCLRIYFGHHNLTSDTEPEEMLYVERKKVMEYYKDVQQSIGEENGDTRIEMEGRKYAMLYFFGDKCLPDKEGDTNVPKPKFKVGDIVVNSLCRREKLTITEICSISEIGDQQYRVSEYPYLWNECELEPYTEEKGNKTEKQGNFSKIPNQNKETMEEKELNHKALYNALCELESASVKVRKALITI